MQQEHGFKRGDIVIGGTTIVLVSGNGDHKSRFAGVVIEQSDPDHWPVGNYSTTWFGDRFKKTEATTQHPGTAKWLEADTKPEHNVGVLVFIPGEDNHITSGMWDISNEWVLLDEYRTPEEEVTHWMPLPAFPEGYPHDTISDEWVSTLKGIAKEELANRPSKEGNKERDIDTDELWDEHSESIGSDIDDLSYWSGRGVMKKEDFVKAIEQFKNRNK